MKTYYLKPTDGRKSFYEKALVDVFDSGVSVLYSYNTPVLRRNRDGSYTRLWDGWSATTGRHIKAFSGLDKRGYLSLPLELEATTANG